MTLPTSTTTIANTEIFFSPDWSKTLSPRHWHTWRTELPEYFLRIHTMHAVGLIDELIQAGQSLIPKLEGKERSDLQLMLHGLQRHQQKIQVLWQQKLATSVQASYCLLTSKPVVDNSSLNLENTNASRADEVVVPEQLVAWRIVAAIEEPLRPIISSYRSRLAHLFLRTEVRADIDPFRPWIVIHALVQATQLLRWGEFQWQLLVRLFSQGYHDCDVQALRKIYAEFDRVMAAQGWVSQHDLFVVDQPPLTNSIAGQANPQAQTTQLTPVLIPDAEGATQLQEKLFSRLVFHAQQYSKNLDSKLPNLDLDPRQDVFLPHLLEESLEVFTAQQLALVKRSELYGLVQTLAALFDYVFALPHLCVAIKSLFGQLQFAILQIAMCDPDFVKQSSHPARQLLNDLGAIGLAATTEEFMTDATLQHLADCIQESIVQVAQSTVCTADIQQAQALADAWQQVRRLRIQQRIQRIRPIVMKNEKQLAAHKLAQSEIEKLITQYPCPQHLANFLRDYWVIFIRGQILSFGVANTARWRKALHTAEMLIWSVQPKSTVEEHTLLAEELPVTLRRLLRGLSRLGFSEEMRTDLLQSLELEHMRALRGQNIAEENIAQPITSFTTINAASGESEMARTAWLKQLRVGSWYDILHEDGHLERMMLAWISARQSRIYLTGRNVLHGCLLTPEEFAHKLQHRTMFLVAESAFIERALENLLIQVAQFRI